MARHAILGNGKLTVGLDEVGHVHDFYFPYVGLENLTTSRNNQHKIGIWVDGEFSWVSDDPWSVSVDFRDDALIAHVSYTNDQLGIHLQTEDFVDNKDTVFIRRMRVTSLTTGKREIRIFMHQVFEISRDGRADTAMYVPTGNYIFDYKGRVCIIASGKDQAGDSFDQYAVGNHGIEGKEGTYKDAEDGELSGSAVEHGGVDSVMRFKTSLEERESYSFDYWLAVGDTQKSAELIHNNILENGVEGYRNSTLQHWSKWLGVAQQKLSNLSPRDKSIAQKSLLIIKAHTDHNGGIIASCDSSIYNYGRDYYSYVWPRDGAFAMWPLIRLGYTDEPKKFFEFCSKVITEDGYLMHKYQPDGAVGSTWHPLVHNHHTELAIQEDETAIMVYMMYEYLRHSKDTAFISAYYEKLIKPASNFMSQFVDESTKLPHASYDLWEEKFLTNTYTVAIVYGALLAASEIAKLVKDSESQSKWTAAAESMSKGFASLYNISKETYRKGILLHADGSLGIDDTIDVSSLYGMAMFAVEDQNTHEPVLKTINTLKETLLDKSPSGGLPRYEHDRYFESKPPYYGNPWFVTTLWLAQLQVQLGDVESAKKHVEWTLDHTLPSGMLSEQIDPSTGEIKSVTPLVWSHAELINTLLDISNKQ